MSSFERLLSSPTTRSLRSLLILSDVEMGPEGIDPFPDNAPLAALLEAYTQPPYDTLPVDLILNGDILDLLKVGFDNRFPRYIDEDIALEKLNILLARHTGFIDGLRAFLEHPSGNKEAYYVVGNHDPEILFEGVQTRLREALGPCGDRLHFPGLSMRRGSVHIEHGHQFDEAFAQDPNDLFATWQGREILRLPWCTYAVMDSLFPLSKIFFLYENLRPRPLMLERMPIVHEVLSAAFARYWSRQYIPQSLLHRKDPTRGLSFPMTRQIITRTLSNDIDAGLNEGKVQELFMADSSLKVIALGHLHRPSWKMLGTRTVLRTGCWRDEFEITRSDNKGIPIPKSYAEIIMDGDDVVDTRLFQVASTAQPLEDLFEVDETMLESARALKIRAYLTADEDDEAQNTRRLSKLFGWIRRDKGDKGDAEHSQDSRLQNSLEEDLSEEHIDNTQETEKAP